MEGNFIKDVAAYYSGNEQEAFAFKTAALDYVRKMPKLLACNRISLLSALVQAAQFNFMPSGVSGEAYIIPYGAEAKFQIGYQGYVTLFYRAGVKSIKANIVYSNEHFRYEDGLTTILEHTPTKFGEKKGEPVGVYAVAITPAGQPVFKVMSKDDVMGIKNTSKAKGKADSPWNSGDPELWMWRKTCLIQLSKLLPKTRDIIRAIEIDYEGEGSDRPAFDAMGPAVGASHHDPKKLADAPAGTVDVDGDGTTTEAPTHCPAGKHDRSRMSEDGVDCFACMDDALADEAPAQQEDIQA
jgi:recombination protein RecT